MSTPSDPPITTGKKKAVEVACCRPAKAAAQRSAEQADHTAAVTIPPSGGLGAKDESGFEGPRMCADAGAA
jgi:hypothetical protein